MKAKPTPETLQCAHCQLYFAELYSKATGNEKNPYTDFYCEDCYEIVFKEPFYPKGESNG
jgi:hypothetical protein